MRSCVLKKCGCPNTVRSNSAKYLLGTTVENILLIKGNYNKKHIFEEISQSDDCMDEFIIEDSQN